MGKSDNTSSALYPDSLYPDVVLENEYDDYFYEDLIEIQRDLNSDLFDLRLELLNNKNLSSEEKSNIEKKKHEIEVRLKLVYQNLQKSKAEE